MRKQAGGCLVLTPEDKQPDSPVSVTDLAPSKAAVSPTTPVPDPSSMIRFWQTSPGSVRTSESSSAACDTNAAKCSVRQLALAEEVE